VTSLARRLAARALGLDSLRRQAPNCFDPDLASRIVLDAVRQEREREAASLSVTQSDGVSIVSADAITPGHADLSQRGRNPLSSLPARAGRNGTHESPLPPDRGFVCSTSPCPVLEGACGTGLGIFNGEEAAA
jgi:hypothetical protein